MRIFKEKMNPKNKKITFCIESELQHVSLIGICTKQLARSFGFDNHQSGKIELSVVEAVNNVIIHSYENQPGFMVSIEFQFIEEMLHIVICDEGRGMKNFKIPRTQGIPDSVALLSEGGRGIMIIKRSMDFMEYKRKNKKNYFILRKKLKPSGKKS